MGNQTKPIHLDLLTRLRQARGPSQAWARQLLLTGGDDCDDLHGNNDAGDDDNYNGDGILISGKAEWLLSLVHLAGQRLPLPLHRLRHNCRCDEYSWTASWWPSQSWSQWQWSPSWSFSWKTPSAIKSQPVVPLVQAHDDHKHHLLVIPNPRSSTEFFSLAKE